MEENRIQKKDIASYSYEELISEMEKIGEKPFRGKQAVRDGKNQGLRQ